MWVSFTGIAARCVSRKSLCLTGVTVKKTGLGHHGRCRAACGRLPYARSPESLVEPLVDGGFNVKRFLAAGFVSVALLNGVVGSASAVSSERSSEKAFNPANVKPGISLGCAEPASDVDLGVDSKITIGVANVSPELSTRWYYRRIPTNYEASRPMPVVIDLHGYSEGATIHLMMSSLGKYGDEKGFITLTPQGQGVVPRWDTALKGSPDVEFIKTMIYDVGDTLCVDANRIFVTGLSNGAMMSSTLACVLSTQVAAIAPVAGVQAPKGCKQFRAVPVVAFHGTSDGYVTYGGGLGDRARRLPAPDGSGKTLEESGALSKRSLKGPSVPETMQAIARRNRCKEKPSKVRVSSDVTRFSYPCSKGRDAVLYRVTAGGHTWPGSAFSKQIESIVGKTTMTISANEIMWRFFTNHPRSQNSK